MSWAVPLDDCTVIVGLPANACRSPQPVVELGPPPEPTLEDVVVAAGCRA